MPNRDPLSTPTAETPRGPQPTPGLPDRGQDKPANPPIIDDPSGEFGVATAAPDIRKPA